jgi:hypothetical protein
LSSHRLLQLAPTSQSDVDFLIRFAGQRLIVTLHDTSKMPGIPYRNVRDDAGGRGRPFGAARL